MKGKLKQLAVLIALILSLPLVSGLQALNTESNNFFIPIRVACVGDSITAITGYPSYLQQMLGSNYSVGNFGVTGSTVLLKSWKPYMNQSEFQAALDYKPNIVFIMLGTNDDLQELHQYNESFEDDYSKLVASFQQDDSNPQIWIMEPPPIYSSSSDLSNAYLNSTLIPQITDLANQQNLPLIDLNTAFENHTDYFVDGVHPNSEGATLIASEVYSAINSPCG